MGAANFVQEPSVICVGGVRLRPCLNDDPVCVLIRSKFTAAALRFHNIHD